MPASATRRSRARFRLTDRCVLAPFCGEHRPDTFQSMRFVRISVSACEISQAGARLTRRVSSRSKSSTRSRPVANRACDTRPCPLSVSPWTGSDSSSLTAQEGQDQVHQDRTLVCRDCAEEFVFSAGEQAFFLSKGLQNDPQRCLSCRAAAKRARVIGGPREFHAAICGSCGGQAIVPFAPRNDRPIYCSSCFDKVQAAREVSSAAPA